MPKKVQKVAKTKDDKGEVQKKKPTPAKAQAQAKPKVKAKVEKKEAKEKPYTLRSETTGDKVWLIKDGKRHWVMNPKSLEELGLPLGQEQMVDYNEITKFPEGPSIDLTKPGETMEKIEEKVKEEKATKPEVEPDKPYKVWA